MDKVKKILSKIFNKKMIALYIAVLLVTLVIYQVITSILLCNMVIGDGSFTESAVGQDIIRGEFATAENKKWLNDASEDIYIENADGHKLHALSVKHRNTTHSYMIIYHPVTLTSFDMADYAYHFADIGFNVILPDLRGCGQSDYKETTFGATDTEDIVLWINKIIAEDKDASIILFGVGSGGSAVLSVCDEELPSNVKAIIEDSGYDTLKDVFKNNIEKYYNKKSFPALLIADKYVESKYGWSINDVCLRDQVHNSRLPILFIHGGDDSVVPVAHSNDMYEVCPVSGTDHLLISGATHCRAMQTNPEKYWRIVDKFVVSQLG